MLMLAGFVACWIWRSLIHQDRKRLDWWWARLRELEAEKPEQLQLVTEVLDVLSNLSEALAAHWYIFIF